jgi:hypothetical protein
MTLLDIYKDKKFKGAVINKKNLLNRKTLLAAFDEFNLSTNKNEFMKILKYTNILDAFADDIVDKNDILKSDNNNGSDEKHFNENEFKIKIDEELKIKNLNIDDVEINKFIIVNNNEFYTLMKFQKIEIMMIDDHADHYYPFFFMKFKNLKIENIANLNKSDYIINSQMKFKTFNYIANLWEPLLEKTFMFLHYSYLKQAKEEIDNEKAEIILTFMNGENKAKLDLNISDLAVN